MEEDDEGLTRSGVQDLNQKGRETRWGTEAAGFDDMLKEHGFRESGGAVSGYGSQACDDCVLCTTCGTMKKRLFVSSQRCIPFNDDAAILPVLMCMNLA